MGSVSDTAAFQLLGCDFSSAPSRRKPITLAVGRADRGRVVLEGVEHFETLDAWSQRLAAPGRWVGGFDLPFGLPRELVTTLGWPTDWAACMAHYKGLSRESIREAFAAFCDARPVGGKFAHRATDGPAGSSPTRLPGLFEGDGSRVGLEAYPGLLARSVLGTVSYKSDDKARQTPGRLIARKTLINALENGQAPLLQAVGLRLRLTHAQRDALADDASGDRLDAVLCLLQAAWAEQQHRAGVPRWGLPVFDPLEGWIVTA